MILFNSSTWVPGFVTPLLHADLLYFRSNQTTGVIFGIERDMFRVLDQTGAARMLKPSQISNKVDSRRSVATDADGHDLLHGDMVKETGGPVSRLPLRVYSGSWLTRSVRLVETAEPDAFCMSTAPYLRFCTIATYSTMGAFLWPLLGLLPR